MELKERLETASNKLSVKLHKPNPNTQDLGSELVLEVVKHFNDALLAHILISYFLEHGARVVIVIEERVMKATYQIASASTEIEKKVREFLQQRENFTP